MSNKNMVKDPANVGPMMRRLRTKRRMSAVEVAAKMGISASAYSRIENSHAVPGIDKVLSFCKVMKLTMIWQNGEDK